MTTIQVEDLSNVKKKITLEVPEDTVNEVIDSQYRDLKKNVQLKGFRKGKVPLDIIRSYFKDQVIAEATKQVIEQTFQPALDEKQIVPIAVLKLDPEDYEPGKPFRYTAEIEVPPPIDIKDYKGLSLKRINKTIDETQVDERLKNLQERNARMTPIADREIQAGDHLVIDVKAEVDGEVVTALTVNDYHMELGRDFYLPGFDAKLEGMKPDESKEITMDLPEDFPRKNIAGKTAKFDVLIKEAKEKILPALDDDLAKDLGDYENLEALKSEIRKDIEESNRHESKHELENQIIDALIEKNEFEVPESMVEQQVDRFLNQSLQNLVAHGIDPKRLPTPTEAQRAQMRPSAIKAVKAGLLLKAIGEEEKLEITDDELKTGIEERAQQFNMSVDYLKDQLENNDVMDDMKASLLQDKIYKFIEEHAEITEETATAAEESEQAEKE
jgi:trigger factor